ncbi:hypothetical protein BDY24DRAFT_325721, partial [Mrakia frigida]|uniref:glycoside hydrolase family protein n=1 Tax=Mrakia frigida TaxID=29902 RepID=UPI003FCC1551
ITSSTIKAGIAWPNSDWIKMDIFGGGNISWYYTWSPEFAEQSKALDIDYVPQLWGPGQSDDFVSAAEGGWSSTTLTPLKEILAFNEPNLAGQALMTPQEGAALWIRDLEPLRAKGYRLGAPATTNAPDGAVWMKDFLTACNGSCTPDFYPLHWYSTSAQGFEDYVTQWHDTFLAPVWITEFAFHDFNGGSQLNAEEISTALAQCQAFLQAADFVERYSF